MRRVGDRVRVGIHLAGRLEAAKDQDHKRYNDHPYNDDKNKILNEPYQEFLRPAREKVRCWHGWNPF